MASTCPNCGSDRARRGGTTVWFVYVALVAGGLIAVLAFHLHAGLIAAIMLAVIILANLVFDQRVCLDCGHQWSGRA